MGVVDDEAGRLRCGEIGAQPVQTVQDRERRLGPRGEATARAVVPGQGQRSRRPVRPRPAAARSAPPRGLRQGRLEQLAHDAEGELALELGAAGGEHLHPAGLGAAPGGGEQRGLADAGRALNDHQAPGPRAAAGQRRRMRVSSSPRSSRPCGPCVSRLRVRRESQGGLHGAKARCAVDHGAITASRRQQEESDVRAGPDEGTTPETCGELDEAIRDQLLPELRVQEGSPGRCISSAATGEAMLLIFWETEDQATRAASLPEFAALAPAGGGSTGRASIWEVTQRA